jgi:hypothetical protein
MRTSTQIIIQEGDVVDKYTPHPIIRTHHQKLNLRYPTSAYEASFFAYLGDFEAYGLIPDLANFPCPVSAVGVRCEYARGIVDRTKRKVSELLTEEDLDIAGRMARILERYEKPDRDGLNFGINFPLESLEKTEVVMGYDEDRKKHVPHIRVPSCGEITIIGSDNPNDAMKIIEKAIGVKKACREFWFEVEREFDDVTKVEKSLFKIDFPIRYLELGDDIDVACSGYLRDVFIFRNIGRYLEAAAKEFVFGKNVQYELADPLTDPEILKRYNFIDGVPLTEFLYENEFKGWISTVTGMLQSGSTVLIRLPKKMKVPKRIRGMGEMERSFRGIIYGTSPKIKRSVEIDIRETEKVLQGLVRNGEVKFCQPYNMNLPFFTISVK